MRTLIAVFTLVLLSTGPSCTRSVTYRSTCQYYNPHRLVHVSNEFIDLYDVLDPASEPGTVIFEKSGVVQGSASGWVLQLEGGRSIPTEVPWIPDPERDRVRAPGYTEFLNSEYSETRHVLVQNGTLRVKFDGDRDERWMPQGTLTGRRTFGKEPFYTGTFTALFQNVPLVQQTIHNTQHPPNIHDFVRIAPDNSFLTCVCADDRGTWLAVYRLPELQARAAAASRASAGNVQSR